MEIISRKEAKEQGLTRYFTGKPCKHGHISERGVSSGCLECKSLSSNSEHYKSWKSEWSRGYATKNSERIKLNQQRRRNEKKIDKSDNIRFARSNAKAKGELKYFSGRACANGSVDFRLTSNANCLCDLCRDKKNKQNSENERKSPASAIRSAVYRLERVAGRGTLRQKSYEKKLGYTYEQLRKHIESQFKKGMSWDNRSEWHLDHKKPIKAFLDEGITDPAIVNALDNLQPLWAHENLSKGAKHER